MINIAVIEDSQEDFEYLAKGIQEYSTSSQEPVNICHYETAFKFLDEYKFDFDIIFMDIALPDINGLMASEKLRKKDDEVSIVFVTNLAHLAIKGYAVEASDFIVKPVNYYKLSALLEKLVKKAEFNQGNYTMISTIHGMERINLSDVMYVEAKAHRITFHLTQRDVTYSGTLNACERMLLEPYFVRCYQSFIVNIRYVDSCDGTELILRNGTRIPMSRLKKKLVMQKILDQYTGARK